MNFIRRHSKLLLAFAIIVGLGLALLYYLSYNYAYFKIRDDSLGQYLGPKDAPITIIEVIDYRCPICRAVDPEIQKFIAGRNDVRILHKHFPAYGDQSVFEAQLALAAGAMGKYEQAHNYLIRHVGPMSADDVEEMGETLNLDLDRLYELMNSEKVHETIASSAFSVTRYGIRSTPAFILHDEVHNITGPTPTAADFEYLLETSSPPKKQKPRS